MGSLQNSVILHTHTHTQQIKGGCAATAGCACRDVGGDLRSFTRSGRIDEVPPPPACSPTLRLSEEVARVTFTSIVINNDKRLWVWGVLGPRRRPRSRPPRPPRCPPASLGMPPLVVAVEGKGWGGDGHPDYATSHGLFTRHPTVRQTEHRTAASSEDASRVSFHRTSFFRERSRDPRAVRTNRVARFVLGRAQGRGLKKKNSFSLLRFLISQRRKVSEVFCVPRYIKVNSLFMALTENYLSYNARIKM